MEFYSIEHTEDDIGNIPLDISLGDSFASVDDQEDSSYTRVKVLGRGAFGEAVLYRKTTTNELVVWKEINLVRATENERNGALNEVEILSQLQHVNIVAYFNDFFDGSSLFIEMEYANDGSLYHKIVAQDGKLLEEVEVLQYFYQLISAVDYIHAFGILHRDIKTLNIFVTKSKIIKLGDFGISKVLEETYGNAETCVGTPYYMSPELVKGESYNQKSDIWACGCVLFELLTLNKAFQASNHLKLLVSILEKDPGDISDKYSSEIRTLVTETLKKEAPGRPFAKQLMALDIFQKAKEFVLNQTKVAAPLRRISSQRSITQQSTFSSPTVSTLTSDVFYWGGGKAVPQKIERFSEGSCGMQVSAGFSHFAVVTIEKELYTWANIQGGTEIVGQLGHGNTAMYRAPKKVSYFDGIAVSQVACGEDFTVILTLSGEVYSCGSNYYGCLGVGDTNDDALTPVRIDSLDNIPIHNIACGDSHVVALTKEKNIYTWGCGEYGRLGLGNEEDFSSPQLVNLPVGYSAIVAITCGRDNTFLLTINGHLLAFGNNEHNKMALNQTVQFKRKALTEDNIIHFTHTPTPVRALRSYKLVSISSGKSHSAAIDEFGRLLTFGSNKYGQLGVRDNKPRDNPCLVRGDLNGKIVMLCSCGDGFTVAATKDNQLFSWGLSDNGRLGIQLKGRSYSCSPKPIFGSLHKVASLSSRHWATIILAEQMLSSKVIHTKMLSVSEESGKKVIRDHKPISAEDASSSGSFKFNEELDNYESNGESAGVENNHKSDGEDTLPPWLVDEMDNAEFIPMGSDEDNSEVFENIKANGPSFRETFRKVKESSKSFESCEKCLKKDPSYLEVRVKELELENTRLEKLAKEQEVLIKYLQKERECYAKYTNQMLEVSKGSLL